MFVCGSMLKHRDMGSWIHRKFRSGERVLGLDIESFRPGNHRVASTVPRAG